MDARGSFDPVAPRSPLRDQVRSILIERIINADLPAGERLNESTLAAKLGVSPGQRRLPDRRTQHALRQRRRRRLRRRDPVRLGSTDSVAWADVDADGDLDLAAGNEHSPTTNYLYTNESSVGGRAVLHLTGRFLALGPGYSNRDAVGAVVRFYDEGFIGDEAHLLGARLVSAHGSFACQNEPGVHFGLGERAAVDVRITWPGALHLEQDVLGVAAGQVVNIEEGECAADCNADGELSILDFVCFQQEWIGQSEFGDCDHNGAHNVLDFVCYQTAFVAGCP